jgi:transcription antitermination factor NusG
MRTLVLSELPYDPCPLIKTGSLVEVTHGPLKGVVGRLQRRERMHASCSRSRLIGRSVRVQIDAADVKAV